MTTAEQKEYEQYVMEYLEDAGIVEPTPGTRLVDMDREKLNFAALQLKSDFDASFKLEPSSMTVSTLAQELWKAVKSR
ncbi:MULTISPECIES: hypothetical protein [unclassified Pseudomonas]|uniref:hypothetical protein n=1 Tax=unclassified Pseudomonas TaxID=196821 RepID=UPI00128FB163|nr:hypothetical protein [Pseudomonas sp. MN1F]MQG92864.1 hypothetical protein [Pseudomonas sp. MN1F]